MAFSKYYLHGLRALKKPRPHFLLDDAGSNSYLPQAYKKFWYEWKIQEPQPVHYIPKQEKYEKDQYGTVYPVENRPIPLHISKEMQDMLLGGEAIVKGFVKPVRNIRRVPKWWIPTFHKSVVFSEILNKHMEVVVTERLLDLIHKHHGFDNYILQTPACDLQTVLALKLKRKMLLALATQDYYPNDPIKKSQIQHKYGKYAIPLEEAEWYGLTVPEARKKYKAANVKPIVPLKNLYRQELVQHLKDGTIEIQDSSEVAGSWITRMNPFAKPV